MLQRLMAVDAAWCRRGIGSKLAEENLKLAQKRWWLQIVQTSFQRARSFEKLGFWTYSRLVYTYCEYPDRSGELLMWYNKFINKKGFESMDLTVKPIVPRANRATRMISMFKVALSSMKSLQKRCSSPLTSILVCNVPVLHFTHTHHMVARQTFHAASER
jgi:hypothetical protein